MKKIICGLSILFGMFRIFALNEISVSIGPGFFDRSFDVNESHFLSNGYSGFSFSASNSNFFGQQEIFGFFEKFSVNTENKLGLELLVGPAFGFDANEYARIQFGPYFKTSFNLRNDRNLYEYYGVSDFPNEVTEENLVTLGMGTEFLIKFLPQKKISPVAGFDFSLDFFGRDFVKLDSSFYHIDYKKFLQLNLRPFLGVTFTFPSKKNDGTQHNEDSDDFQQGNAFLEQEDSNQTAN